MKNKLHEFGTECLENSLIRFSEDCLVNFSFLEVHTMLSFNMKTLFVFLSALIYTFGFPSQFTQVSPTLTFQTFSFAAQGDGSDLILVTSVLDSKHFLMFLPSKGFYEEFDAGIYFTSDLSSFEVTQITGAPVGAAYSASHGYLVAANMNSYTNIYLSSDGIHWTNASVPSLSLVGGPYLFQVITSVLRIRKFMIF